MLDRESDQADLDEVLLRVDEARQALPKILRALEPARRSVEGPSHSERLNLYKTAVKDANRSLTDLRDHFQEHQGLFKELNASYRADGAHIQLETRSRYPQHLLSQQAVLLRTLPFDSTYAGVSISDVDELQALCDQIAADLGCLDILETSRRQVKVRVQGVLLAILTLHWHDKADTVLVEHINCYALTEASHRSHQLSAFKLFNLIPAAFQAAIAKHDIHQGSNLQNILHMLAAYRTLFTEPCFKCQSLLSPKHSPPAWRLHIDRSRLRDLKQRQARLAKSKLAIDGMKVEDESTSQGVFVACHRTCWEALCDEDE